MTETWVQVYEPGSDPGPDGAPLSRAMQEVRELIAVLHSEYDPRSGVQTRLTRRDVSGARLNQYWRRVR